MTLTRAQLEAWVGRAIIDEDVRSLGECIPHSAIPDAVRSIVERP